MISLSVLVYLGKMSRTFLALLVISFLVVMISIYMNDKDKSIETRANVTEPKIPIWIMICDIITPKNKLSCWDEVVTPNELQELMSVQPRHGRSIIAISIGWSVDLEEEL